MEAKQCIEQFEKDHQMRYAPKTIKHYQFTIRQMQDHLGIPYHQITRKNIRDWLLVLEEKGYKPTTIMSKLIGLKTFYKYCLEEGIITSDPVADIPFPKVEQNMPKYLTKPQIVSLQQQVAGRLLERAIVEVFLTTGVRISELVAIKKEDINWTERSLRIPEGKWKKERIVLFSIKCGEYLKAYLESRVDELPDVFVNQQANARIRPQTINAHFISYSKRLGFRVIPHMLRHTFAAQLVQKGMPLACIQQLMGHNSPQTTQLYARLYNQARKEMYDRWT